METLPITIQLIILVLLLGVNGFFSAAEVALVSVRKTRMYTLSRDGVHRADLVLALIRDPDRIGSDAWNSANHPRQRTHPMPSAVASQRWFFLATP